MSAPVTLPGRPIPSGALVRRVCLPRIPSGDLPAPSTVGVVTTGTRDEIPEKDPRHQTPKILAPPEENHLTRQSASTTDTPPLLYTPVVLGDFQPGQGNRLRCPEKEQREVESLVRALAFHGHCS